METQSGARTPLVDPFGRELEEWLRDAPATRSPYLADLVVPPVTGPVQRPDLTGAAVDAPARDDSAPAHDDDASAHDESTPAHDVSDPAPAAFRRDRTRARHAACAPAFPEPPARIALRIEDLAVEVAASTGRPTIERIVLLEDEVRRRDEDLARLAAWEATVAELDDPEVEAARAFAHTVFADLLADAAAEADRRERSAARRAAHAPARTTHEAGRTAPAHAAGAVRSAPVRTVTDPSADQSSAAVVTPALVAPERAPEPVAERDEPARPAPGLLAVTPVSANTRPTPLVQPATGPTVVDRAAFAAALTTHVGATASTPVVLPESARPVADESAAAAADDRPGWWQRFVARLLRVFGRA